MDKELPEIGQNDGPTQIARNEQILAAYGTIGAQLFRVGSGVVALLSFAYLVGWARADAYYSSFGARWLVTDLSLTSVVSLSAHPVAYFVAFLLFTSVDLAESAIFARRARTFVMVCFFVGLATTGAVLWAERLARHDIAVICADIVLLAWVVGAATMLSEVVETLRDREFRWNSWAVYTIAVIFYFALIVGPKTLGSAEGARDAHPEHSTLPFVVLQGQTNEEWRLLRISGEKFYIAQLRTDKEDPRIRLIEGTSAEAVENRRPSPPQAVPPPPPASPDPR